MLLLLFVLLSAALAFAAVRWGSDSTARIPDEHVRHSL